MKKRKLKQKIDFWKKAHGKVVDIAVVQLNEKRMLNATIFALEKKIASLEAKRK